MTPTRREFLRVLAVGLAGMAVETTGGGVLTTEARSVPTHCVLLPCGTCLEHDEWSDVAFFSVLTWPANKHEHIRLDRVRLDRVAQGR